MQSEVTVNLRATAANIKLFHSLCVCLCSTGLSVRLSYCMSCNHLTNATHRCCNLNCVSYQQLTMACTSLTPCQHIDGRLDAYNYFFPLARALGNTCLVVSRIGGSGMRPICAINQATRSDGWAPHDIQYRSRSESAVSSFMSSLLGKGL